MEGIAEYMATTIICVICFGTCVEMGETIGLEKEPYYWLYITVYALVLVVYKHIFINKIAKREPIHLYSKVLFNRLFGIYLFFSTIISAAVEYFIMSEEERYYLLLYIPLVLLFNYIAEKRYHYWGLIFFNTKIFVAAIFIVTICNFIVLHFAYKGAALIIGVIAVVIIISKGLSAMAPNGMIVDNHGNIGFFYRF